MWRIPGFVFRIRGWLDGTYCCDTPGRQPDHRFHQSGCDREDLSGRPGSRDSTSDRQNECPAARSSGSRGGLLRSCFGVVHAVVLSGGASLLVGGHPVARPVREGQGGGEVRYLAGPYAAWMGTFASTARRGGSADRRPGRRGGL